MKVSMLAFKVAFGGCFVEVSVLRQHRDGGFRARVLRSKRELRDNRDPYSLIKPLYNPKGPFKGLSFSPLREGVGLVGLFTTST